MTLEEINSLILDDVINDIKSRVFANLDPQPVFNEETDGDFKVWYDALFTQEQLDAEFLVYKQELTDIENERLRKVDLEERFNNLKDMRLAFHALYPDKANPALWLKELLEKEPVQAESEMTNLETKDDELSNSPENIKQQWIDALKADLENNNISMDGLLEALVRKVILGDSTLANLLVTKLQEIDDRNPRP